MKLVAVNRDNVPFPDKVYRKMKRNSGCRGIVHAQRELFLSSWHRQNIHIPFMEFDLKRAFVEDFETRQISSVDVSCIYAKETLLPGAVTKLAEDMTCVVF